MVSGSSPAVIFKGVSKSFGDVQAVKALDLEIEEGCVYGLLGPNGSGKTTILKTILGEVAPITGSVKVGNKVDVAYFQRSNLPDSAAGFI